MNELAELEMKNRQDYGFLRTIVHAVVGIDVAEATSRTSDIVNAKMIYSKILRDRGHVLRLIGISIHKHHSTVHHYLRNMDNYLNTDKVFLKNYKVCKEEFDKVCQEENDMSSKPVEFYSFVSVKKEAIMLKIENKDLYSKIEKMEEEREQMEKKMADFNKDIDRVGPMFNMVRNRTRPGTEAEVLAKLNKFYNGLYYH